MYSKGYWYCVLGEPGLIVVRAKQNVRRQLYRGECLRSRPAEDLEEVRLL